MEDVHVNLGTSQIHVLLVGDIIHLLMVGYNACVGSYVCMVHYIIKIYMYVYFVVYYISAWCVIVWCDVLHMFKNINMFMV